MPNQNTPSPFPPPFPPEPEYSNPEDAVQQSAPTKKKPVKQEQKQGKTVKTTFSSSYFTNGQFAKDVTHYQQFNNQKTGYEEIDKMHPFYPGLYCLGAISSLGKTTFVHQMADQIAMAGGHVLYFSLEQTSFELFSKSLARGFAITNHEDRKNNCGTSDYPMPSSLEIRQGKTSDFPDKLAAQIDAYTKATGDRLCVIDGSFSLTVEDICSVTENHMKKHKVTPVVIVDYLQIVSPSLINGRIPDTKTSIDHIVHTLKVMQAKHDLRVVVISSLNRQNYLTPIDFESFKESGGIEYTADVIWGLQLSVLEDEPFSKDGNIKKKREMIKNAKARVPRQIDLVCLKNRNGVPNYTLPFAYYAICDYFI